MIADVCERYVVGSDSFKIGKFKLISEKIQIFQKKGRHLFLYVIPNAKSL